MQNNKNKLLFSVLYLSALMSPALARADQAAATGFDILRTPPANAPVDNRVKDQSYRYADGTEYTGIWKAGVPDGEGKLKLPDGSMFLGFFHEGLPEGKGVLQQADGSLYQGNWHLGQREGDGVMEYANGNRYEGEWAHNQREGAGQLQFPSGTRFDGLWKEDMRNGRGELRHKTGEAYIGDYANDVPHGYGTEIASDGSIYAGTFSNGKRHGVGDCTDTAGHSETCVYKKGVRIEDAAALARANAFKARYEPQFQFSDGVALLWLNNLTRGKGLINDHRVSFTKRAAMLGNELKIETRGQNFYMLMVIKNYHGPQQYRLSGDDIVVSLDGETPLFLAGNDAGQVTITADKDTAVEGELLIPKLFANGKPQRESFGITRGQFRALPSDFQTLKKAAAKRPPMGNKLNFHKLDTPTMRSQKPLVNGTQPANLEELIQQVSEKGQKQGGDDSVQSHGKR